jgi:hypothetical protein
VPIFKPQKIQVVAVIKKERAAAAVRIMNVTFYIIFASLFIWHKKSGKINKAFFPFLRSECF